MIFFTWYVREIETLRNAQRKSQQTSYFERRIDNVRALGGI